MSNGYLYYKTDKDVFDALHSQKFSKAKIIQQLKDRGILVSSEDEKDDLIEYVSPLFLNYHDQRFIIDTLNKQSNRKTFTTTKISANLLNGNEKIDTKEFIANLVQDIKKNRETNHSEIIDIHRNQDGSYVVKSSYTEADYSKSVMSQNLTQTVEFKIWEDDEGLISVRASNSNKTAQLLNEITDEVRKIDKSADKYLIELSAFPDSSIRNEFFFTLLESLEGFENINVKSIYTANINEANISEEGELLPHVNRLDLNGNAVTNSKRFQDLKSEGYYITKIEWSSNKAMYKGEKVEFLAEFKDHKNCNNFLYAPLRIFKAKDNGDYNLTPSDMLPSVQADLLSILEKGAISSHKKITAKYSNGENSTTPIKNSE